MTEYTTYTNLYLPNFNFSPWHDEINHNFRAIDVMLNGLTGIVVDGIWENSTLYTVGTKVFDPADSSLWRCLVEHTSRASGTMATDRAANPTYWGASTASDSPVLNAIAAVSPVTGSMIYFTNSTTASVVTSTSAGRSMLAAADAAAQRALLSLGTAALVNTGTSGGAVPLLNANATIDGIWTTTQNFTIKKNDPRLVLRDEDADADKEFADIYNNNGSLQFRSRTDLDVFAAVGAQITRGTTTDWTDFRAPKAYYFIDDPNTGITNPSADTLAFVTGGTEHGRFASGGGLHLGKTATDLEVDGISLFKTGQMHITRTDDLLGQFNREGSDGTVLEFLNDHSVVGSISVSGSNTAYNTTSDERLKSFRREYPGYEAIQVIKADPVREFAWKDTGVVEIGWGAQTSYAVRKDLASYDETRDTWSVDLSRRTPHLWAAVRLLIERVERLEHEIRELKKNA